MSDIAVGIGEVPTARMPERTNWDIIFDTCIEAVEDSGIGKDLIQGVVSVAPVGQPVISGELAFGLLPERLGLKGVRDSAMVNAGGASTSNALRLAEQWIASGIADSVLVQQVTVFSTMPVAEQIDAFARAGVDMQWEYPYGSTYNIIMGLMATRYMYESGASPEEMASVVTALRSWAEHDPHSLFYGLPLPRWIRSSARTCSTPPCTSGKATSWRTGAPRSWWYRPAGPGSSAGPRRTSWASPRATSAGPAWNATMARWPRAGGSPPRKRWLAPG